jgi:decaprenylphospho-beta-D-ribofuranose 2-oxidase
MCTAKPPSGSFCQHVTSITLDPRRQDPQDHRLQLLESHRGGLGQTGIIAQATLQLTPTKGDMMLVTNNALQQLGSPRGFS